MFSVGGVHDINAVPVEFNTTVILTVSFTAPPRPLQAKLNWLPIVNPEITWEPIAALLPDQSPDAVQLVALELFQDRVVEPLIYAQVFGQAIVVSVILDNC